LIKFKNVKPPWTNVKPRYWNVSGYGYLPDFFLGPLDVRFFTFNNNKHEANFWDLISQTYSMNSTITSSRCTQPQEKLTQACANFREHGVRILSGCLGEAGENKHVAVTEGFRVELLGVSGEGGTWRKIRNLKQATQKSRLHVLFRLFVFKLSLYIMKGKMHKIISVYNRKKVSNRLLKLPTSDKSAVTS